MVANPNCWCSHIREQFAPFQRQQQNAAAAYNRVKKLPPNKSDTPPARGRSLSWSVPISFESRSTASESNSHSDDSNDDSASRLRGDSEDCTTSSDQVDPKKAKRLVSLAVAAAAAAASMISD